MAVRQIFYVTQGTLSVWLNEKNDVRKVAHFVDDDEGIRDFALYVAANSQRLSAMLVDVIEEEFVHETTPKLSRRDRNTLVARRLARRFRQTPFRQSTFAAKPNDSGEHPVVLSAITNHELIQPWLDCVMHNEMSLAGIYSVPLIAPQLFARLFKSKNPCMFIAQHQGQRLRQVFIRGGKTHSARLSKSPQPGGASYAQFVATEAARSRRYLERSRLLLASEKMDVCVVADPEAQKLISKAMGDSRVNQLQFVDSAVADKKVGTSSGEDLRNCERWYIARVAKQLTKNNYAVSGESRYWHLRRFRSVLQGTGLLVGACCSIAAAILLSDAWHLHNRIEETHQQVELLSETFRRENQSYDSIRADSAEMKLAVDTGDYILENRVPVPWVMNQIGSIMSRYPDIHLRELSWQAEHPRIEQPPQRRAGNREPQPIPLLTEVSAILSAEITPFDGDMRAAFARIDEFAAHIEAATNFNYAQPLEYPLNANTSAALSGEIDPEKLAETATFQLRIRYTVPGTSGESKESGNEPI